MDDAGIVGVVELFAPRGTLFVDGQPIRRADLGIGGMRGERSLSAFGFGIVPPCVQTRMGQFRDGRRAEVQAGRHFHRSLSEWRCNDPMFRKGYAVPGL